MLTRRLYLEFRRYYSKNVILSPFGQIDLPTGSIDQYTMEWWSKWEDKTAVECGLTGKTISYKELRHKSKALGSSLSQLGLQRKTALFVLPNCPEFPMALLGALQAGMTVSAANPIYTPGELRHQANDAGANCVVTDAGCLDRVLEAVAGLNLPVISIGGSTKEGVISLDQLINKEPDDSVLPTIEEKMEQLAMLPYSSGTTGLPKGVRLRHSNITANIEQIAHPKVNCIMDTTENHQDVIPAVLPFFHIYGSTCVMLRCLRLGAKLVTLPKFDPMPFLQILAKNRNIVLHAVPPIINFLGNHPLVKPEMLQGLRFTMTGAAPCSPSDIARMNEKKPHTILQAYGMTEASPVVTFPLVGSTDTATIGAPIPNTMAKVVDPNTGDNLSAGLNGELCFKGPQVMEGYHKNPKATAETLDSEGWLRTGDIGYADEEGNFFIVDRLKELIKVKGFQVAPAELEALLRQHPKVAEAGVTSAICPRSGELPIAFLVPVPGCSIDPEQVSSWMSDQVASYKRPAKLLVVNEIPKSPSGKILRRELKEIAKTEVRF
ncbi:uncharacterized protein [Halyomorpha halys]|uniref:uncharacterized protein n=1 Tax=Halyomorpha halys TaxID=286706 RepID=UPI0006D5176D|nr:4-coumarate--CoA ligase 1-like [Halyomorpha halys]